MAGRFLRKDHPEKEHRRSGASRHVFLLPFVRKLPTPSWRNPSERAPLGERLSRPSGHYLLNRILGLQGVVVFQALDEALPNPIVLLACHEGQTSLA